MSRLSLRTPKDAQHMTDRIYGDIERRIAASPPDLCSVDLQLSFLKICHAQSCGKCTPCRIGLKQLQNFMEDVLENRATFATLDLMEKTAKDIELSADCAIGYEAARMVLAGLRGCREEYIEHIETGECSHSNYQTVPCVNSCPAGVDIPGYVALVRNGQYADAVKVIRKDNPFPTACAFICENPCESKCRRTIIDSPVNIRGLKRYAVDHARNVSVPVNADSTGKRVAVIGGGPGGLSAAYYLALMGHQVVVFEEKKKLGGMLRYGIPNYRLPRERLDEDIKAILSTGIEVRTGVSIGEAVSIADLKAEFDAVYIAVGAHMDKKLGIEGEDGEGVISAVSMLAKSDDDDKTDVAGKRVVIIGGGNVAMDCARSAQRLGAETVSVIYRRRREDMTALPDEIEGAVAEGVQFYLLQAPNRIELDKNRKVTALIVQPQLIGTADSAGRPKPFKANKSEIRVECDIVVVAVGQATKTSHLAENSIPINRDTIEALEDGSIEGVSGVFSGGDCVTGPATVIRSIAAGKVAAANIDTYLGFHHIIRCEVAIPQVKLEDHVACGRVNLMEREACSRKNDFETMEYSMSDEETAQEASRCLRCDYFGFGALRGGRVDQW